MRRAEVLGQRRTMESTKPLGAIKRKGLASLVAEGTIRVRGAARPSPGFVRREPRTTSLKQSTAPLDDLSGRFYRLLAKLVSGPSAGRKTTTYRALRVAPISVPKKRFRQEDVGADVSCRELAAAPGTDRGHLVHQQETQPLESPDGRYAALKRKSLLMGLDANEERELAEVLRQLEAEDARFYEPILDRLESLLRKTEKT